MSVRIGCQWCQAHSEVIYVTTRGAETGQGQPCNLSSQEGGGLNQGVRGDGNNNETSSNQTVCVGGSGANRKSFVIKNISIYI